MPHDTSIEINALVVLLECERPLTPNDAESEPYTFEPGDNCPIGVFSHLSEQLYEKGIFFVLKVGEVTYVTLSLEFCIFLEEFHDLAAFVADKKKKTHTLYFYEQGANYLLSFERQEEYCYALEFLDELSGVRTTVKGSLIDLRLMLTTFYSRVIFLAEQICPSLSGDEIFADWRDSSAFLLKI